jgi:hypothetical protein
MLNGAREEDSAAAAFLPHRSLHCPIMTNLGLDTGQNERRNPGKSMR